MTQFITGFNRLNRHESLVNPDVLSTCRLCEEDEETSWHLAADCPALLFKRRECFKENILDDPPDWRVYDLQQFLLKAKIKEMNERETRNP